MESNVADNTTPEAAETAAPPRRRASRRVSAAAGAAAPAASAAAESAPAEAAAPAANEAPEAEAPAAEAPAAPKKRATRSRKKVDAPEEPADASSAAAAAPAADAAPEAAASEAPAEAPKKRAPRTRKKAEAPAAEAPAEVVADGAAPAEASAEAAAEAPAQEAPAKRTRSRRATAATAAPQTDAAPAAAAQADEAQAASASASEQPAASAAQQAGDGRDAAGQQDKSEQTERAEKNDAADSDRTETERSGRNRRGRGRGQKNENADSAEQQAEAAGSEDEGKSRGQGQNGGQGQGQGQNGPKNGDAKNGESSARSSRTRQRDRKRRGQGDDLEPEITEDDVLLPIAGILDVLDNYAFVRTSGYLPGTSDVYVSLGQVKKYGLRRGDAVVGAIRQPRENDGASRQKYNAIVKIDTVNGRPVDEQEQRIDIADLTPIYPDERLRFETTQQAGLGRSIDLVAPAGLGQRAALVLPAQADGTAIIGELAESVSANRPDAHLVLLLANAQPEEITRLQRSVRGEVVAASFDRLAEDQATIAELAIDRAKRLVELGHDVVVLVDSLNRFARAYAQAQHAQSRPALDEIDEFALTQIKRLLSAARNVENGGSLTVYATVQTKTGLAADKLLLREVLAIVNSEIRFEKAAPGLAPVVDLVASRTRNPESVLAAGEAEVLTRLRAELATDGGEDRLRERLASSATNAALLAEVQRSGALS